MNRKRAKNFIRIAIIFLSIALLSASVYNIQTQMVLHNRLTHEMFFFIPFSLISFSLAISFITLGCIPQIKLFYIKKQRKK